MPSATLEYTSAATEATSGALTASQQKHATPQAALLALQEVSVVRHNHRVLHGINLQLQPGSVTAVIGPSGAGKSTLLATLNGLLSPTHGQVLVNSIGPLDSSKTLQEHRHQTATVFQEHALIARLSALENVLLGLADRRHPLSPLPWPKAMRQEAINALAEVGLLEKALKPVAQLSGGERQRVGIARALVRQPVLLLADEPFASVDPALCEYMADEFLRLVREQGLTLVIVLHQLDLACHLADRIVGIAQGRVVFDGLPEQFTPEERARIFPRLSPTQTKESAPTH